jgi:hypothetical protein
MMLLKAKALAVGLMMAGGVATPVATYYTIYGMPSQEPALPAQADLAPEVEAPAVSDPLPTPGPAVVLEEAEIKPAPKVRHVAKVATLAPVPKAEEKKCEKRQLQTVGSGTVVICDVERSSSGKAAGGIFAPIEKPATLAPRDLPSPTGLIR